MEKKDKSLFFFFYAFLLALLMMGVEVHGHRSGYRRHKLFVFGDSSADTGNLGNLGRDWTRSWYEPYGITFPNRPAGRFSDGRVLTDYVAGVLGNKSPIPYKFRRYGGKEKAAYGMNFAVAGSGVFDTGNLQRNLSEQIDTFQAQVDEEVFSRNDIKSGIALLVISGNDYLHFLDMGHGMGEVVPFIVKLINQVELELERIHKIGVGKVVVANLHPVGCTPQLTRTNNYAKCNESASLLAAQHNQLLLRVVDRLQKRTGTPKYTYHILDLNTAFTSIIHQEKGVRKFKNTLRPCCEGKGEHDCAQEDSFGVKQYTLCPDPEQHCYWDSVHPTQAAWAAVFQLIRPWLTRNLMS